MSEILDKFKILKNIFNNKHKDTYDTWEINCDQNITAEKENYYLISTVWIKNMITFIEKYESYIKTEKFLDHLDKIFNKNNVINLYFSDEINNDLSRFGIYPCQVNNFFIMQFKDAWIDPEPSESHTNIYIKKGMIENEHFFYVNQMDWEFIKNTFGYNFEILRKTANISGNLLIEVNLRKVIYYNNK
jgi:hypothetical protein